MAVPCIWQIRDLKATHHRILWWFVDAGAIGKPLVRGWQLECAKDLGIHRLTLHSNLRKMLAWGILSDGDKRGEFILTPGLFVRHVDRAKVAVKEA